MNTNSETNTGVEQNTTVINKRRGRPINVNKTRKVYLVRHENEGVVTYFQRSKGAPRPGSATYFVNVQRNVKSKDFAFNDTMQVQTEVVKARVYKPKAAVVVENPVNVAPVGAPVEVPTIHETASNGVTVTHTSDSIVVDSPEVAVA